MIDNFDVPSQREPNPKTESDINKALELKEEIKSLQSEMKDFIYTITDFKKISGSRIDEIIGDYKKIIDHKTEEFIDLKVHLQDQGYSI